MCERIQWHRLAGLVLTPLFNQLGCDTQIEVDVALQRQLVDLIVVRKGRQGADYSRLPPIYWQAFDDLNSHNLITVKSYSESFNAPALEEFYGHLTNYRKVNNLTPDQINLYAIVNHYPRELFWTFEGSAFLTPVVEREIFDFELRPLKRVRVVITRATTNPVLALFSGDSRKVFDSYTQLQEPTTLLSSISGYLNQISRYFGQEVFNMYTKEDFMRDYPPTEYAPFAFPWEKEYHDQELKKVKEAAEKAAREAAEKAAREAAEKGRMEGKMEAAKVMLSKGMQPSFISEITGLSETEILTLKS